MLRPTHGEGVSSPIVDVKVTAAATDVEIKVNLPVDRLQVRYIFISPTSSLW